jgi:hypothetical protein
MKDLQITENNMRIKRGNVLIAIISIIIDMIRYEISGILVHQSGLETFKLEIF